jgi:hypothetical protein
MIGRGLQYLAFVVPYIGIQTITLLVAQFFSSKERKTTAHEPKNCDGQEFWAHKLQNC